MKPRLFLLKINVLKPQMHYILPGASAYTLASQLFKAYCKNDRGMKAPTD